MSGPEDRIGKHPFTVSESGSAKVARIIVADTIRSINGNEAMLVETLKALAGPEGDTITQSVMGEYLATGGEFTVDGRVLRIPVINVNAAQLKGAMSGLLETYFRLPDKARTGFFEGLTRFETPNDSPSTSK